MFEAAEDCEDLFPFQGGAEWNRNRRDGTRGFCLSWISFLCHCVRVSKQALTPQELLHHLGKGDLRHIPCAGGWDWAPEHMENESCVPGEGIASELGTCGSWWLRKETQEFLP